MAETLADANGAGLAAPQVGVLRRVCLVLDEESVNFEEIARCTEDFSGAMLRAVCVEAGMIALRRNAAAIQHEDFMEGISQVASRKKANLMYYA